MDLTAFNRELDAKYTRLRAGVKANPRDYDWRIAQLKALKRMLEENDKKFCDAMWADLHKPVFECVTSEQGIVLSEIDDALKNLHKWMRPRRVGTSLYNLPGSSKIVHDPLGLTLIIGAWNYPINLLLAPLVGAIAGGNGALLKPSELAVATAKLIAELIPQYMDTDLIDVIQAGPEETSDLLDRNYDLIFFTGSGGVGRIVMGKAAKNLTPVVLELGGKSPAFVLRDANIDVAAKRLVWGKFMNGGQTCVAPDYILVEPEVKAPLIAALSREIKNAFGENPKASPDYCRIINAKNYARLTGMLAKEKILFGGQTDETERFIAPTLVAATIDDAVMKEEIFGPILPIVEMSNLGEMIDFVNSRDKPLSLYIFSESSDDQGEIVDGTSTLR